MNSYTNREQNELGRVPDTKYFGDVDHRLIFLANNAPSTSPQVAPIGFELSEDQKRIDEIITKDLTKDQAAFNKLANFGDIRDIPTLTAKAESLVANISELFVPYPLDQSTPDNLKASAYVLFKATRLSELDTLSRKNHGSGIVLDESTYKVKYRQGSTEISKVVSISTTEDKKALLLALSQNFAVKSNSEEDKYLGSLLSDGRQPKAGQNKLGYVMENIDESKATSLQALKQVYTDLSTNLTADPDFAKKLDGLFETKFANERYLRETAGVTKTENTGIESTLLLKEITNSPSKALDTMGPFSFLMILASVAYLAFGTKNGFKNMLKLGAGLGISSAVLAYATGGKIRHPGQLLSKGIDALGNTTFSGEYMESINKILGENWNTEHNLILGTMGTTKLSELATYSTTPTETDLSKIIKFDGQKIMTNNFNQRNLLIEGLDSKVTLESCTFAMTNIIEMVGKHEFVKEKSRGNNKLLSYDDLALGANELSFFSRGMSAVSTYYKGRLESEDTDVTFAKFLMNYSQAEVGLILENRGITAEQFYKEVSMVHLGDETVTTNLVEGQSQDKIYSKILTKETTRVDKEIYSTSIAPMKEKLTDVAASYPGVPDLANVNVQKLLYGLAFMQSNLGDERYVSMGGGGMYRFKEESWKKLYDIVKNDSRVKDSFPFNFPGMTAEKSFNDYNNDPKLSSLMAYMYVENILNGATSSFATDKLDLRMSDITDGLTSAEFWKIYALKFCNTQRWLWDPATADSQSKATYITDQLDKGVYDVYYHNTSAKPLDCTSSMKILEVLWGGYNDPVLLRTEDGKPIIAETTTIDLATIPANLLNLEVSEQKPYKDSILEMIKTNFSSRSQDHYKNNIVDKLTDENIDFVQMSNGSTEVRVKYAYPINTNESYNVTEVYSFVSNTFDAEKLNRVYVEAEGSLYRYNKEDWGSITTNSGIDLQDDYKIKSIDKIKLTDLRDLDKKTIADLDTIRLYTAFTKNIGGKVNSIISSLRTKLPGALKDKIGSESTPINYANSIANLLYLRQLSLVENNNTGGDLYKIKESTIKELNTRYLELPKLVFGMGEVDKNLVYLILTMSDTITKSNLADGIFETDNINTILGSFDTNTTGLDTLRIGNTKLQVNPEIYDNFTDINQQKTVTYVASQPSV